MEVINLITMAVESVSKGGMIAVINLAQQAYSFSFDTGEELQLFYDDKTGRALLVFDPGNLEEDEGKYRRIWITPNNYKFGNLLITFNDRGKGEINAVGNT